MDASRQPVHFKTTQRMSGSLGVHAPITPGSRRAPLRVVSTHEIARTPPALSSRMRDYQVPEDGDHGRQDQSDRDADRCAVRPADQPER